MVLFLVFDIFFDNNTNSSHAVLDIFESKSQAVFLKGWCHNDKESLFYFDNVILIQAYLKSQDIN